MNYSKLPFIHSVYFRDFHLDRSKSFGGLGCNNVLFFFILLSIGCSTTDQPGLAKRLSIKLASFTSRENSKKKTDEEEPNSPGGVENPDFVP